MSTVRSSRIVFTIVLGVFASLLYLRAEETEERPLNFTPVKIAKEMIPRAMWIWKTHLALKPDEQENLFRFCEARHLNRLYLYVGQKALFKDPSRRKMLEDFITKASDKGIAVEALDGWPEAIFPDQQQAFLDSVQRVIDYNKSAPQGARFVGYQSDVEPEGLKGYRGDPEERISLDRLYLDVHRKAMELVREANLPDFVFGVAIGEKYDTDPESYRFEYDGRMGWAFDHMIRLVDYIAMMSYYDRAPATARSVAYEIDLAARLGKPLWIGQETIDAYSENIGTRAITFYEEGVDFMEEQIAKLAEQFAEHPGFAGFAIHFYDTYRRLPQERSSKYVRPEFNAEKLKAPAVDAAFGDWEGLYPIPIGDNEHSLAYGRDDWEGGDDLSGKAWLGWTEEALYLYVEVRDDRLLQFEGQIDLWKGDHVETWIELTEGGDVFQIGLTPGDFGAMKPHAWVWYPKEWSEADREAAGAQIEVAARKTDEGYVLEAKIPVSALKGEPLKAQQCIAMSTEIGDADHNDKHHETLLSSSPMLSRAAPDTFPLVTLSSCDESSDTCPAKP